jgi:hypothetical protein
VVTARAPLNFSVPCPVAVLLPTARVDASEQRISELGIATGMRLRDTADGAVGRVL